MREIKFRMWNSTSKKYHYDVENVFQCLAQQNVHDGVMPTRGFTVAYDHVSEGCVFEQLLHKDKTGREWYVGDIARINIYVPPTNYHDGNGWLNNDDGFEGYAIGEVIYHNRFGMCITNYTLTDLNTEEVIPHTVKYKTIPVTRSEIIGNIHDKGETK